MIPDCPDDGELVEREIDRVLTQYRESPNLLFTARTYLRKVEEVIQSVCALPDFFNIETAVGDQLTLIGKRLGFPRCHCYCAVQPVFGFECNDNTLDFEFPVVGFCEIGTWKDCGDVGVAEICITDDDVYRAFLKARRYQFRSFYSIDDLTTALRFIWGPTAWVMDAGKGRVVMTPGRDLTADEVALLQIVARVLPIAPGINPRFHFGPSRVFGFGEGWGGFCEEYAPDGLPIVTADGMPILVTDGTGGEEVMLMTGPLVENAAWMCEIDVHPYDCIN